MRIKNFNFDLLSSERLKATRLGDPQSGAQKSFLPTEEVGSWVTNIDMSDYHIIGWVLEWISEIGGSGRSCSNRMLKLLRPDSILINCARGHIVLFCFTMILCPLQMGILHASKSEGLAWFIVWVRVTCSIWTFWGCPKVKRVMCIRNLCLCGFLSRTFKTTTCFKTDWSQSCKIE